MGVAEGVLERRRGLLLLQVADQHVRVEVDDQHVDPSGARDPRSRERPPGGLGPLRPRDFPSSRPRSRYGRQRPLTQRIEQTPARGIRGDRPEQRRLVSEDGDVRDGFGSVGCGRDFVTLELKEIHEEIDYFPIVIDNQYSAPVGGGVAAHLFPNV